MTSTVAGFADVQNLEYTARQAHQRNVDYNALWARATGGRQVVAAHAYAVERGDEKQRQFQNILRAIGSNVKLKPFLQRADGPAKGDGAVCFTLDTMELATTRRRSAPYTHPPLSPRSYVDVVQITPPHC